VLGHVLLGDVEEGCDEREGKNPGGDATGDQPSAHVPTCGLAIHCPDFYQDREDERGERAVCPSPKTVAQLVAVLGATVVSGAFVEGHTALPSNPLKARCSDVGGDRHREEEES
jgi:hypothetical protein